MHKKCGILQKNAEFSFLTAENGKFSSRKPPALIIIHQLEILKRRTAF